MKVELRRVGGFYSFYSFFTVFFFHSFDFVYYFFSINIRVTHVRFGRSRLRLKKSTNKKKKHCAGVWSFSFMLIWLIYRVLGSRTTDLMKFYGYDIQFSAW